MINIKAIQWKHPQSQFICFGELTYSNFVWENAPLTEVEIQQAESEYAVYLQNIKPMEDIKKAKIQSLREQQIDRAIQTHIDRVHAATSQSEIDAITLP